jgi:RNA polymerase sigma-70 factor, ECF subfamily
MTDASDRLYERVVVLRCQAGDDAAFEELVGRYSQRLRYYLRKMLREADRAEDVLQDVWLQVLRGLPRLADPGAFPTWLYRVARDRVYGELRKARHTVRPLEDADVIDESAGTPVWTTPSPSTPPWTSWRQNTVTYWCSVSWKT